MFEGKPRIVFKIEEPPPMGLVGWSDSQLFSRPLLLATWKECWIIFHISDKKEINTIDAQKYIPNHLCMRKISSIFVMSSGRQDSDTRQQHKKPIINTKNEIEL